MTIAKMEVETDICTDEYPTPETFERWRQDIIDMDAKVKSGEIQIKSIREQFADHGYIFD